MSILNELISTFIGDIVVSPHFLGIHYSNAHNRNETTTKNVYNHLLCFSRKKKNEINNTVWQLSKLPVELLWMYPSIAMSMKNFITTLNFVASAVIMLIAAQQQKIMFTFIWVKMFFLYFYIYKIVQNKRKHRIFHGFDFQASFHASILWIFMNA